jgi:hypothetical protein
MQHCRGNSVLESIQKIGEERRGEERREEDRRREEKE